MLLEFSVANFLSFNEETRFDLRVNKNWVTQHQEAIDTHLKADFEVGAVPSEEQTKLLRCVALYGANAAGKSNLIKALSFMRNKIQIGFIAHAVPKAGLSVKKFLLDDETQTKDSLFEVMIVVDGHCYQYGFCCNGTKFTQEWLFKDGSEKAIFKIDGDHYEFSDEFVNSVSEEILIDCKEIPGSDILFLTKLYFLLKNKDNCLISKVFHWFKESLRAYGENGDENENLSPTTISLFEDNEDVRAKIKKLINKADSSIVDLCIDDNETSDFIKSLLKSENKQTPIGYPLNLKNKKVKFLHKSNNGKIIELDSENVSKGIKSLFNLSGVFFDALLNDRILFIDDIGKNLHPLLLRHLIDLFHEQAARIGSKAQLVFTTHDTSLMRRQKPYIFSNKKDASLLLRQDQIWFVVKQENQSSDIYPLIVAPVCEDQVQDGYLSGEYAAIPIIDFSEV